MQLLRCGFAGTIMILHEVAGLTSDARSPRGGAAAKRVLDNLERRLGSAHQVPKGLASVARPCLEESQTLGFGMLA